MCVIVKWEKVQSKNLWTLHYFLLSIISIRAVVLISSIVYWLYTNNVLAEESDKSSNKTFLIILLLYACLEIKFAILAFIAERKQVPELFTAWIVFLRCSFAVLLLLTVISAYLVYQYTDKHEFAKGFALVILIILNWAILYHALIVSEHLRGRIRSGRYPSLRSRPRPVDSTTDLEAEKDQPSHLPIILVSVPPKSKF